MPPKKTRIILPPPDDPIPVTIAQEVLYSVKEWYRLKGVPVPKEDMDACLLMLKEEQEEAERVQKQLQEWVENPPPSSPIKAEYGSPEFWKDYWAKKKAAGFISKKDQAKENKEKTKEKSK